MTVATTVTSGAVHTHPAVQTSSPVRMGAASLGCLSVMKTMTVEMGRMSRSTYATPQNPPAPLISSTVTTDTALRWGKCVTIWMTARTTAMKKAVVSIGRKGDCVDPHSFTVSQDFPIRLLHRTFTKKVTMTYILIGKGFSVYQYPGCPLRRLHTKASRLIGSRILSDPVYILPFTNNNPAYG